MTKYNGKFVRFYVNSNDFTTAAAVVLYNEKDEVVTLGAGEQLAIQSLQFSNGAAATRMQIYSDIGNGTSSQSILARVNLPISSSIAIEYPEPLLCGRGKNPKVNAAAASTDSSVNGVGIVVS